MKRKTNPQQQPSTRAKLSAAFLEALEEDFRKYGKTVIEEMRTKDPTRYAELAGKMMMTVEAPSKGFEECRTTQEMSVVLLKKVGCKENAITDEMIEQTCKAQDLFEEQLRGIAAMGQVDDEANVNEHA